MDSGVGEVVGAGVDLVDREVRGVEVVEVVGEPAATSMLLLPDRLGIPHHIDSSLSHDQMMRTVLSTSVASSMTIIAYFPSTLRHSVFMLRLTYVCRAG